MGTQTTRQMDCPTSLTTILFPLPLSYQAPFLPPLGLSPDSLTGTSAPRTEPTFRVIF